MNRTTSLYLDILRPFAALIVLLSHIGTESLTGGRLTAMSGMGVQAVDIFFVLSGFVIAHVCATKENSAYDYFISRAARIYSVALPAVMLTFALDRVGLKQDASAYQGAYQAFSPGLLIRSLFFIGEQWNSHRFPGSDSPYWSLGFEVWYYIAFGAFLFISSRRRWIIAFLILVFIGPKVALLFPIWLMGVFTYRFCKERQVSETVGWILFTGSMLLVTLYQFLPHSPLQQFMLLSLDAERLKSTAQDYFLALLCCFNIVGFAAISHHCASALESSARPIRWVAGGTFSLYLIHLPIMHFLSAFSPWPRSSDANLALLLIVTPIACYGFAEFTERRKRLWHDFFKRLIRRFA